MPRCRQRFEDIFDREKQAGQSRVVVQQEELVRAAEENIPGDQRVQMEQEPQQQQHASTPDPSVIHHPVRVTKIRCKSTQRRARIPEDVGDTRAVRPRLEMSTLTSELCERDVPQIDWEKLGDHNSSVFDIYTGLRLDEAQVKAGPETDVKRILEFEVYEEVSEEQAGTVLGWTHSLVRSRLAVNQVRGACKREDVFAATPPLALHLVVTAVASACGMAVAFFHVTIEEEVFVRPSKNMRKDKTIWKLLKAMCGTQVASSRWQRLVTLRDGHWKVLKRTVCCIQ